MAKDPREYGYEGEMVMSQLKGIMNHAKQLHDMLEPSTDLPEWVQSKITLAYDYMQTAADYMATEMKEEYSKSTAIEQRMHSIIAHPVHGRILSNAKYQKGGSPNRPYISAKAFADKTAARHNKHDSDRTYTVHKLYPDSESTQHIIKVSGPKRTGYFAEETAHSVHVKTYDSQGEKQMNSPEFKKHVTAHGGELDYPSDKGAAFKFKSHAHAAAFHRGVQSKFKELDSEHDMHEDMAMGHGPVNVAANVADPQNKKLFTKPMKRFKSFKAK